MRITATVELGPDDTLESAEAAATLVLAALGGDPEVDTATVTVVTVPVTAVAGYEAPPPPHAGSPDL